MINFNNKPLSHLLVKSGVLTLCCYLIAGIPGVVTVALMFWLSRQTFAVDSHEKHGISHQQASRLGGIAVAFGSISIYWLVIMLNLPISTSTSGLSSSPIVWCSLIIGLLGLLDDLTGGLSALVRIAVATFVFAWCLFLMPEVVPEKIGIFIIDGMMDWRPIAYLLTLFVCIGLLNATNMADGANGLMPLVFMGSFYAYMLISGELLYLAVSMSLLIFTLFNVLSGRLFLGDAGSYGLGALAALGAMQLVADGEASIWLLLCLAAYPVIDFFVSCVRRLLDGRSPLSADSDHLHNRLYRSYRQWLPTPLLANSAAGLSISLVTTGVSLWILMYWSAISSNWIFLFLCYIGVYALVFWWLASCCKLDKD